MIHSTAAGMMTHNPLTKYAMTLHVCAFNDCAFNDAGEMSFDGGCRQFETCLSMSSEGTL